MISKNSLLSSVAVVALLAASGAVQAAITVYTTQASFLAAVTAPGTDSFDDLDYTQTVDGPLPRTAGPYSYGASAGPTSSLFYPASGDIINPVDIWLSTNNRQDTIYATGFSAGVTAVGGYFFGSNLAGVPISAAVLTVSATDTDGTTSEALLNTGAPDSTFRGFVSTGGLTSLSLWVGAQGSGETDVYPTINDLTLAVAVAVPEPQTYALMLGGLALLGWAARRNKRG